MVASPATTANMYADTHGILESRKFLAGGREVLWGIVTLVVLSGLIVIDRRLALLSKKSTFRNPTQMGVQ